MRFMIIWFGFMGTGNQFIFTTSNRHLERMVPAGMWFEFRVRAFWTAF